MGWCHKFSVLRTHPYHVQDQTGQGEDLSLQEVAYFRVSYVREKKLWIRASENMKTHLLQQVGQKYYLVSKADELVHLEVFQISVGQPEILNKRHWFSLITKFLPLGLC